MDAIDNGQLFNRAAAAQDHLVEALTKLHETQVVALLGQGYDSSAYDDLIESYRRARREANAARAAWERSECAAAALQHVRQVDGAASPPAAPSTASTPRLLFARWLYQAGYISG